MTEVKKTYRISKGWLIASYILGPLMIGGFVWGAFYLSSQPQDEEWVKIFIVLLFGAFAIGMSISLYDTYVARFIIYPDRFVKVNWNKKTELYFKDVKGYDDLNENYVFIRPEKEHLPSITLSRYMGQKEEWLNFIRENFVNLPELQERESFEELMENPELGIDDEQRVKRLKELKRGTTLINGLGWATCAWLLFYPRPYELAVVSAIVIPILALLMLARYKGLIMLWNEKGANPTLTYAFMIPPLGLMIRVLRDYDIFDNEMAWIYTFSITPIVYFLFLLAVRKPFNAVKKWVKVSNYTFLGVIMGLMVYFGSVSVNCAFDESKPNVYDVTAIGKSISKGKYGNTYYIEISTWEKTTEPMKVSVSKSKYEAILEGDIVNLYLKPGLLDIPWVYLGLKD